MMTVTKSDIVQKLSNSSSLTQAQVDFAIDEFMEIVEEAMVKGDRIELRKFGVFEVVKRKKRRARNPKTNEEIVVPERYEPNFRFSSFIKDSVKNTNE